MDQEKLEPEAEWSSQTNSVLNLVEFWRNSPHLDDSMGHRKISCCTEETSYAVDRYDAPDPGHVSGVQTKVSPSTPTSTAKLATVPQEVRQATRTDQRDAARWCRMVVQRAE